MYVTFSSTTKNERIDGKIHKYYIECKGYKQARSTFWKAKGKGKTHYVSTRFSTPRYPTSTHKIVAHYISAKDFVKGYKPNVDEDKV